MAKILVVDDSKVMRSILKAMLVKLGHEVIGEAADGMEAYEKYFELNPDIVTMDITMPKLDGIKSLQRIKESDHEAKIVMVTSNAQKDKLTEAFALGAFGYILKPLTESKLKDMLDSSNFGNSLE